MDIVAIIVICLLCAVLIVLCAVILIDQTMFGFALSRKCKAGKIVNKTIEKNKDSYLIDHTWWDKQKLEKLEIKSFDGLSLAGFFIDSGSDKLAILVHGYARDHRDVNNFAELFSKRGYSILAVDCRAHGQSEGDMKGFGWLDRLDLKAWIEHMVARNSAYKIVLFGQSMGASTVCMTLGEKIPKNVVCAISDCAFDNVYREFYHVCKPYLRFLTKPLLNLFNSHLKRTRGFDLKRADAVKALKDSHIPVFLIHGKADNFVPVQMCYRLSQALPQTRRDILLVEDAGHMQSYSKDPKGVTRAVDKFLSKFNM